MQNWIKHSEEERQPNLAAVCMWPVFVQDRIKLVQDD